MTEALLGFAAVFVLALLRVPLAFAMGAVGIVGLGLLRGWAPTAANAAQVVYDTGFAYTLSVVPLFILMGNFVARAGLAHELFRAAYAFIGHWRGGLAHATVMACAGFGAICGSSIATAATMSKVAYPPMKKLGYADYLSTGVIAAGGTLGIMIPPSTIMVIYGIVTETNIGKLFAAGVIPGLMCAGMLMAGVSLDHLARPPGRPGRRARGLARAPERAARHLGRGAAGGGGAGRHLRRRVHRHRGRRHRRLRRLLLRAGAPGADAQGAVRGAGGECAHHRDAVHDPDRGDAVLQLRQLHHHAGRPEGRRSSSWACRR
jgi:hypothetical protein